MNHPGRRPRRMLLLALAAFAAAAVAFVMAGLIVPGLAAAFAGLCALAAAAQQTRRPAHRAAEPRDVEDR